jgi:dTDP-4-amino-4,6-dideoxygalactose transaminase
MDDFITINRRNYEQYEQELSGLQGMSLLGYDEHEKCNYQYVVLEIESGQTGLTRDQLMGVLHAENVLARRYFYPGCHRMEPYRSTSRAGQLPETEKVAMRVLCLPTGTAVSQEDIAQVCQILKLAIENADAVRRLTRDRDPSFELVNSMADNSGYLRG